MAQAPLLTSISAGLCRTELALDAGITWRSGMEVSGALQSRPSSPALEESPWLWMDVTQWCHAVSRKGYM